ncbi:hypothetical protein [Clostridium sp. D53t1_180928_C8]|uniref:tetratricopeptide repeat protein n=1 Tax=Clostridium sp. D53t1_180928_C8 TaxID=2787101 RepID=UPI0018A94F0E|nr:hypothetical protein [Clostridium sp. D53t1_180928_C8]
MTNKIKRHKKKIIIGTCIIIVIGIGILGTNSRIFKEKMKYKFNKIYYSKFESEEYKNHFKETYYKNYKILHNEETEVILPLLFSYLDKVELKATEIFGYIPKSDLTIQLDFNKEIFEERLSIGDPQRDGAGYYNTVLNTIYMNVEDVYRDIIKDLHKIEKYDDGTFLMQSMSFKDRLFNLYYEYLTINYLKDNNLNKEIFPSWFIHGLREYYSSMSEPIYDTVEFLALEEFDENDEWIKISENKENSYLFAQSTYLIHKMIKLKGESGINKIIENCKTKSFNESFNEVMEVSLDEFEYSVRKSYHKYDSEYYAISNSDYNEDIDVKIQCLEEYIKFNEDDIRAYEFLGSLYGINDEDEKAIGFLKDSIRKYPKESVLWWELALIYEKNNMFDLAKECYDKHSELSQ